MKKKIKISISIALFIIGCLLLLNAFIQPKEKKPVEEEKENNQEIVLKMQNLNVEKTSLNELKISFDLLNSLAKELEKKDIKLNFYEEEKLLYQYEYTTKEMSPYERITIEVVLSFPYNQITKYEFVVDNQKQKIEPIVPLE